MSRLYSAATGLQSICFQNWIGFAAQQQQANDRACPKVVGLRRSTDWVPKLRSIRFGWREIAQKRLIEVGRGVVAHSVKKRCTVTSCSFIPGRSRVDGNVARFGALG